MKIGQKQYQNKHKNSAKNPKLYFVLAVNNTEHDRH